MHSLQICGTGYSEKQACRTQRGLSVVRKEQDAARLLAIQLRSVLLLMRSIFYGDKADGAWSWSTHLHLVPKLATVVRVHHLVQAFVDFVGLWVYREPFVRSSKPNGHYMYRQFNIQQFYVLPTQCIYVFLCGSENKQWLFPYTALTDWFL